MDIKDSILFILNNEIKPAIGCTEPVAIALCAAAASSCIKSKKFDEVETYLSSNIYKNGMNVGIPNTSDIGLDVATALGVAKQDYSKGLQILGEIDDNCRAIAKELVDDKKVSVKIADMSKKVYIKVIVKSEDNIAEAIIEDKHDNITSITLNGKVILEKKQTQSSSATTGVPDSFFDSSIMDIINAIDELEFEDIKFLLDGIAMNLNAAEMGMSEKLGIGTGYAMKKSMDKGVMCNDLANQAMMLTSAASDARMSGKVIPVMSSSGSGNNGLTAILPLAAYKKTNPKTSDEKMAKSLAISHVITSYVKHYIGRLSPLCGCSIAAATGSASAITWLMGGNSTQIQGTIKNILANLSGVICDGAKPGCSLKLGTAAAAGVQSSLFAMQGFYACKNNGIVTGSAEQSIKNLKSLSNNGMDNVDKTIIDIMLAANN
ncbi:serine dehydratase subunit alpha family protein [Sedimentibacter sp. zth1]|uniref:L-cysteine desulfidase family protein n=1 Tax=Sedimentibacter sp. zth1 TaxID=2816908 RepID=UPI001A934A14|nr:L-serine ammonia-lyase, iron-sulfur-dependent, subunit alpha [Sedimentibacter sp. zth1]QSX04814.1 serine dehydratase subunit alpha family protein [Sedimentibacter sp. zth1]